MAMATWVRAIIADSYVDTVTCACIRRNWEENVSPAECGILFDADIANVCNSDNTILVHLGAGNATFGSSILIDSLASKQSSPPGRRRMLSASTADPQVNKCLLPHNKKRMLCAPWAEQRCKTTWYLNCSKMRRQACILHEIQCLSPYSDADGCWSAGGGWPQTVCCECCSRAGHSYAHMWRTCASSSMCTGEQGRPKLHSTARSVMCLFTTPA